MQLTTLDLSGNHVNGQAMCDMCEALQYACIRRLKLAKCNLDSHACGGLAFLLDNSLALQHLDIVRTVHTELHTVNSTTVSFAHPVLPTMAQSHRREVKSSLARANAW